MHTLRALSTTFLLAISLLVPHLASAAGNGTNQQPIQRRLIHVVALRSRDSLF